MSLVSQLFESQPDATPYSAAGIDMSAARYMEELPTSVIDEWPGNREVDGETVALLARDISAEGILQPVLVRPRAYGRYQLSAGHHRVAAVRLLASQNPGERRWEAVRALAVDWTEAEAERAVVATNVYMTPSWKPPASRRAVEWMRLGEEAMRMRADDPGRWRGTRTDDMIAAIAKERGIEHLHPDAPGAGAVYILEHPVRRHGDAVAPVVAEIAPAERLALPGRRQPQWLHHRVGHIAECITVVTVR